VKRSILSLTLAVIICSSMLAGLQPRPLLAAIYGDVTGLSSPTPVRPTGAPWDKRAPSAKPPDYSCANPLPHLVRKCDEVEAQILASTVRLEWHVWMEKNDGSEYTPVDGSAGHATIKEGRYLVTHNHLAISLSEPESGMLTTVSVFAADGKPLWLDAPVELVAIAAEDAETLVLDFGNYGSEGLFAALGLSSAEFRSWDSLPLHSGQAVAQINWDGETTDVDWVKIQTVITDHGTPRLELASFVMPGASGGGIFWNGYHIANTWTRNSVRNVHNGTVLRRYSVAALNPSRVVAKLQ
jgi:hypothetical protein